MLFYTPRTCVHLFEEAFHKIRLDKFVIRKRKSSVEPEPVEKKKNKEGISYFHISV